MTIFVLAPSASFVASEKTNNLEHGVPSAMLAAGDLRAYSLRSTGTLRHLELCPLDTERREAAEWISEALETATVKAVARDLHVSVATVRRFLLSLELTEQIEAGEWDDLRFGADGEPEWLEMHSEEDFVSEVDTEWDAVGADCEPAGTTGEELEDTLRASVAQQQDVEDLFDMIEGSEAARAGLGLAD